MYIQLNFLKDSNLTWIILFNNNHLFAHSYVVSFISILYKEFLNRSIWPIDRTLTHTTILGLDGSKGNERVLHTHPELEPHHRMHTQDTLLAMMFYSSLKDAVGEF